KVELLREAGMRRRLVGTDTDDSRSSLSILREGIAEGAGLLGAPRRVVLRVEVENDCGALAIRQADPLSILILGREVRSGLTNFQHARHSRFGRTWSVPCHTGWVGV